MKLKTKSGQDQEDDYDQDQKADQDYMEPPVNGTRINLDMMRVNSLMLGSSTSPTSDFSFCASLSALLLSVWERQVLKLWNLENFDNAKKVRNPFKHLNPDKCEWPVKIHRSWIHCQGQLSETSQQPMMMRSLGNNQRRGEGTPAARSRLLLKKVSTDTVLSRIVSSYFSYRSVLLLVCRVVCVVVRFIIMTWVFPWGVSGLLRPPSEAEPGSGRSRSMRAQATNSSKRYKYK